MPEIAKLLEKKYPKYWDQSANVSGIRTRTLSFLLLAYCGLGISLCVVHFLGDRIPLMQIVLVFSAVALIGVLMLRAGINMKYVGHYAMVGLTVAILTNTLIYGKANHTTTIQFIFVLLSASFYLLGARWGLIYSIINVALTGAIMFTRQCTPFSIPANTYDVDSTTYYFSLSYNYATLLYIHFRFFKDSEWANLKEKTLVEELRTTAAEAHGIADYKTNFLTMMSHEIRTPLHAIVGGINILSSENPRQDQQKPLESVSISAAILNSVVDDILNLNEIEANHIMLRKEVFQPHFTVNSICDILRPDAKRKGLFLSVISSPQLADLSVIGDSVRLSQVLMNLIGNSIRYTEKGHIEVAVDSKHSNDNQVQISFKVSDTGIGIPQEFQAHIFEPFKIIHAHSKKQYHGTGFGLPLVRKLVNLLGGVLDFTSQEGLGTTFSFSIPYPVSVKPTPVETTKPVNSLAPLDLRVLIAEDNKMNTLVLTNFLKKWQVQFTAVENGLLAVESIKQGHYDAVLMDINMPIMDGIEASRQIRSLKQEAKSSVTIIALTAANVKSFEANPNVIKLFDDWMSKPFHPQKLHEKLSKLI